MVEIVTQEHQQMASRLRDIQSVYERNSDLVSIGAYKAGSNPKLDFALTKIDEINAYLMQGINENFSYEESLQQMARILK